MIHRGEGKPYSLGNFAEFPVTLASDFDCLQYSKMGRNKVWEIASNAMTLEGRQSLH